MNYLDRMIIRALTEGRQFHNTPTVNIVWAKGPKDRLFWEQRESTLGNAFNNYIQGKLSA
jgi:hypothetical protein